MALVERTEVAEVDKWDLSPIYDSRDAWLADYQALEARLDDISVYRGRLGESSETLREAMLCFLSLNRSLEKLYVYCSLKSDENTADSENLGYKDQVLNLYARLSSAVSFLTPELLSLDDETIKEYLADPQSAEIKRMIIEIVRYKPHTLSHSEENLLALGTEVFGASQKTFSQLNNADLDFGTVEVEGKEIPLSHSSFILFLKLDDREVREKAFKQYYSVYEAHQNTIAATLSSSIKKETYLARVRNYNSSLDKALFSDNVNTEVYDNLISTVSAHLEPLHRYYSLRKNRLQLDSAKLYDTHVPLVADVDLQHSYEEAVTLVIESLQPLGAEYCDTLKEGMLDGRWTDRYENKGKRSGAYMSDCYDAHPYMLLNYKAEELNSVFTMTHEAGHAMHSYFSNKTQNYQDHGYTIFVAEVASTFNEQLLTKRLKEKYTDDPKVLAFLINEQIDDIKATLYRQTMFAEFERITHAMAEDNQPLTVDSFRGVYQELLVKYFGPGVDIEERDQLECFRIPHFYSAFYVYKYATGLSAAISLSERVLNGGEAELNDYLSFLKGGCSDYPIDLLKGAGVDMSTPEPVVKSLEKFASLLDELEAIDLS